MARPEIFVEGPARDHRGREISGKWEVRTMDTHTRHTGDTVVSADTPFEAREKVEQLGPTRVKAWFSRS
jgi:hypothetical protein